MSEPSMPADQILGMPRKSLGMALLWFLATIQCVFFYVSRVPSQMQIGAYEQGLERSPFQYRLMLMGPLRWAHDSSTLTRTAAELTQMRAWFPGGVRPEGIVEGAIDLLCVATAGVVARRLYQRSSRTGLLTAYVYPLTLLMVFSTYSVLTIHVFRFLYDLPSLAFFSIGFYLIYAEWSAVWFVALFLVATTNRETTLVLLVFYVLAQCSRGAKFDWRRSYAPRTLAVILPLCVAWMSWRIWMIHRFAANASAAAPRVWMNLGILAIPLAWPQLLGSFGYVVPLVFAGHRYIRDRVLRAWLWGLPVWFVFMLYYGVFVEVRIFGELIPYMACVAALIAEETLLHRYSKLPSSATFIPVPDTCLRRSWRKRSASQVHT